MDAIISSQSIASLWSKYSDANCCRMKRFTTKTEYETITVLKILSYGAAAMDVDRESQI